MRITTLALASLMACALPVHADYLKNSNLSEGSSCWHGDGETAFLKPDGTEGADGDPGVIPVLKLPLSQGSSHLISQEFETRDKPTSLHVKVDVFASGDFKRSKYKDDYTIEWRPGGTWYWSGIMVPDVDFWIRGGSTGWFYKLANLKPGGWVTVDGSFQGLDPDEDRIVNFCVPPGEGTIYIKNPSVTP